MDAAAHEQPARLPLPASYIVDFACLAARLLIEVDGGQHAERVEQDQERTAWPESRGFRVLRFWNDEVLRETDGVVEAIWEALRHDGESKEESCPTPSPTFGHLPREEGGLLDAYTHPRTA